MLEVVKGFLAANILKVLAFTAAVATVLGVILGARQAGRSAERVDQLVRQIKGVQRAEKVRRKVADDYRAGNVPDGLRRFYIDRQLLPESKADPKQHAERTGESSGD